VHASQLFARNVVNLMGLLIVGGEHVLDLDDDIVAGTIATRGGDIVHPFLRERYGLPPLPQPVATGGDAS
jgi:NAD(P) transhydrogenase subunit alpha